MSDVRVVLTGGFDRSLHTVALAELMTRRGHRVEGIIVVSPINVRRLRTLLRTRESGFLLRAARRMAGLRGGPDNEMAAFLGKHEIHTRSLRQWAKRHGTFYLKTANLNAPRVIESLRKLRADGVVYGGGGILRREFIEAAAGRILNAHAGPLPSIRGMNACEWSVLLDLRPTVTIHFIDAGIDTGPVIDRIPVRVGPQDTLESLRQRTTIVGLTAICDNVTALLKSPPRSLRDATPSRQCYVMAPVLRELAELRLRSGQLGNPAQS